MSWPFTTLRILYPLLSLFSLIIISLLSTWVSSTNSFSTSFDSYYKNITKKQFHSSPNFPIEIYLGFIFSIISLIFSAVLSFPRISRKFGYKVFVYLTNTFLSIVWFLLSILIITRVNNGSIIDSKNITDQLQKEINELHTEYASEEAIPDTDNLLSFGKAITAFGWIQFLGWTLITIILAHIRSRKWTKKDRNKKITIVSQYDKDAQLLNTPAILKEIDELVRNPQIAHTTKDPSSKTPVMELNLQLTKNTTTTYSLDPASFTPTQSPEVDFYSRALYDYK
ncbi:20423_t:CDS:1 [Funneliformis geosporum]|uniref:7089_t:CDS:1 n=1 Tax=Funneliformis geosporum TaxID=1117311 RepID=A0A9W4WQU8_9GLOM|nr:20423_t:CDS:1 [Funneliformis geosporum]CAI2165268.1 7089_t:CDS:1 [Funneliformis geosporum]